MKKSLLLLCIVLVTVTSLKAQTKIRVGVNAGLDTYSLSDIFNFIPDNSNNDSRALAANHFGIVADAKFTKLIGVSLGINKTNLHHFAETRDFSSSEVVSYLDIPLLFRISTPGKISFYLEHGFQYSFLLDGKDFIHTKDTVFNKNDIIRTRMFATVGRLGFEVKAGQKLAISAGVKVCLGFTDVFSNNNYDIQFGNNYNNSRYLGSIGFEIGLHYSFPEIISAGDFKEN